jgi:integrase
LEVVRPLWHKPRRISAKGSNPTAYLGYKTLQRIETILDWWIAHGEDGTRGNPARWKGQISKILPHPHEIKKLEHRAAIPYEELPEFFAKLQSPEPCWPLKTSPEFVLPEVANLLLQFIILTCVRANEACKAKWDEIEDLEGALPAWTIPAGRMKKDRTHRVPLAPAAVAVLKQTKQFKVNDFIFPSHKSHGGHVTYQTLLRHAKAVYGGWRKGDKLSSVPITTHGMRAALSTWRAERTSFPEELGEAVLAHKIPNATKASYQRGDLFEKRRPLMQAWADFVTGVATTGDKVVPLIRKRL